jgi:phenylalanyl-tRNA synthetase beta subunit
LEYCQTRRKRFENDLTPEHASYAMRELSGLMLEVFPDAVFEDVVDIYPVRQEERQITFTAPFISKKLGVEIGGDEIEKILKNYTFVYERNDESFTITPSHLRLDLQIPEDMVEEIGRVIGYDRALPILPAKNKEVVHSEEFLKIQAVRNHLLSLGYNEVKTYAFRKKGDVEVARGVGDKSALRKNLTDGIKESYELNRLNAPLLGLSEVKIFEIGTIFTKDGEFVHVATADKKGVIENTLDEFWKTIDNSHVTFDSNKNGVNSQWSHVKSFKMWSQYPFITRDIAFWLGGNTSQEDIEKLLNENKNALVVKGPTLIDSFTKDGRTSLAYRFVFQSYEKTLTDEEVGGEMEKITKTLESLGCEIR